MLEEMLEAEKAHVEGFAPEAFTDETLPKMERNIHILN